MKNIVAGAFGLACAIIIATPQSADAAREISRKVPVDDKFISSEISYTGGISGGYSFMLRPIVVNGKIELCGIGVFTNIQVRGNITRGLRNARVMMNGKPLIKDLTYFARARSERKMRQGEANCRATGVAAPSKIESFNINWGNMDHR